MLERRQSGGGVTVAVSRELEARGFLVAFTERSGGVSRGQFRSLNLGFSGGDDPGMVRTNRRRVRGEVAGPSGGGAEGGGVARRSGSRSLLDLPLTVARFLTRNGVRLVDRATECTACESARFFSHRRDGTSGRQAMVAVRLA